MKKSGKKLPFKIKKTRFKPAEAAFGLASHPYKIRLKPGHDELVQIEIPLDPDRCAKREVNRATIRVFRWDENSERFHRVENSGVDERWKNARARIFESGIYVAAGASSNPWVENAVATMRMFGSLLHDSNLGPIIRHRLCPLILCSNLLGGIFEEIGDPRQHGLPSLPPRDLCEICTGTVTHPGHAVDLYPVPDEPPTREDGGRCVSCNLNTYLECNPRIRRRIIWRDPSIRRYDTWTEAEKADLAAAFDTIRADGVIGLPETAPATASIPDGFLDQLSAEVAWQAYIAHLAHTLVVDACGWVDWSISSYADTNLGLLLDSDAMFSVTASGHYRMHKIPHGYISHGDPTRVYQWLRSEGLIASSQLPTVARVLEWCRDNMEHFNNWFTPDNADLHWQYRGFPPVERVIAGTDTSTLYGFSHLFLIN